MKPEFAPLDKKNRRLKDFSVEKIDRLPAPVVEYLENEEDDEVRVDPLDFRDVHCKDWKDGSKTYYCTIFEKGGKRYLYFVDTVKDIPVASTSVDVLNKQVGISTVVEFSNLKNVGASKTLERHGLGLRRYQLADNVCKKQFGWPLTSGETMSDEARSLWRKLVRMKIAERLPEKTQFGDPIYAFKE